MVAWFLAGRRSKRAAKPVRRKSVAGRLLVAFVVLTAAFALVAGWSVVALRSAARQARLMRVGYLPLTRSLRDLVTLQDTWNAQLNHITTARNPADARLWFDGVVRLGRPKKFSEARAALNRSFLLSEDDEARAVGRDLSAEIRRIERALDSDNEQLLQLFESLSAAQAARAERARDTLVRRGLSAHRRLARLDERVLSAIDGMSDDARAEERMALRLLIALSASTVLLGGLLAWMAKNTLAPLGVVTRRARIVASGDVRPQVAVDMGDEIGELAVTFEKMVAAIATAREQLLKSERLAAVGKMAAHVTHEIRNPLSSMALNLDLLSDELPPDAADARVLVVAIQRELERLSALTAEYLALSRQRGARLELEDLLELVHEALAFMSRDLERHGVNVRLELPETPLVIRGDEAQLKQVLFNLVRNAREAMPDGGELLFRVTATDSEVELLVQDPGVGVPPDMVDVLFEPFISSKDSGTGLGLAITREILTAHGGSIYYSAVEPQGSRFTVKLPRVPATSALDSP